MAAFLCCFSAIAQQPMVQRGFKTSVPGWLQQYKVPAVGVAILENGHLSEAQVFGEQQSGIPATVATIFNVASLTKPITTLTILKLVNAGLWDLDEPLDQYWIDPDVAADQRLHALTTRMVLSHQSGFPNWRWNTPSGKLAFEFAPETRYQYSGEGFEYLKMAIENRMHKPLEALAKQYLFDSLGMIDTRYTWDSMLHRRFAQWHDREGRQSYSNNKRAKASAADDLLTTVTDYSRFAESVLDGAGLRPKLFQDMITPQVIEAPHRSRGLGWTIINDLPKGEYALFHAGSDDGVRTVVVLLPRSKRGLILFTNGDNGMQVIKEIVTAALDCGSTIISFLNEPAPSKVYPGKVWDTAPDPATLGWNPRLLAHLRQYIIDSSNTTGMMVVDHGRVVFSYGNVADNSYLASCRKSILAMLFGPFVANGTIELSTTLDELKLSDIGGLLALEKKATIRQLLTARSGVYHPASNKGDNLDKAPKRGSIRPGTYWLYNNWDFNTAGYILETKTGRTIYQLVDSILAKPLQLQDWNLSLQHKHGDSTLSRYPAYHLWFSTRDIARIGYLMLRKGGWKDEQILPADWIKTITSTVTPYSETLAGGRNFFQFSYGYLWWLWNESYRGTPLEDAYTASGAFGQFITVIPKMDLVIAHKTNYDNYGRSTPTAVYLSILSQLIKAKSNK